MMQHLNCAAAHPHHFTLDQQLSQIACSQAAKIARDVYNIPAIYPSQLVVLERLALMKFF